MAVEKSTPCYICWFFTILLAITAGELLSDALRAGFAQLPFIKYSNSLNHNSESLDSSENKTSESTKTEAPKKDLPIVKLSPKIDTSTVKLSPEQDMPDKDIYIKVLPDKVIPKEKKPGYQTTLQTCKYWTKEYKKEATRKNAAYMEAACNRLESYE